MNFIQGEKASALIVTRRRAGSGGFTLVEVLVSLAVLVVTGIGSVSGFMLLNRFASDNRDRSAAKALCQERIEQTVTMPFNPKSGVFPSVVGQDGNTYWLLGKSTDYSTANSYTGTAGQQTSSTINASGEAVTIYKQANGSKFVTGFRTTSVTNAGSANLVRVAVTVTYTIRGQTQTYTLYSLRSPD